jgi:hypothetical protein
MKRPRSYLALAVLASGTLYFAYSLSASGRTLIDWVVLGLVCLAILWNLFKLAQRLYRAGGRKDLWHFQRTLLFWVIGLLNTLFARPEDVGSWKYYLGWGFLAIAIADTIALHFKERAAIDAAEPPEDPAQGNQSPEEASP